VHDDDIFSDIVRVLWRDILLRYFINSQRGNLIVDPDEVFWSEMEKTRGEHSS